MIITGKKCLPLSLLLGLFLLLNLVPVSAQDRGFRDVLVQENAANKLLNRSRDFSAKGQFSQAAQELISIMDYYPEFSKIDLVYLELGGTLFEMQLYSAADKIYKYLIRTRTNSPMVPQALYGLARINYLQGNFDRTLDFYNYMNTHFPKTDIDDGMLYYAGLSHLGLNQYDDAISSFDQIPAGSDFRGYGLYSRAIANFKKKILTRPLPI